MQSKAKTVAQYLAELPPERRQAIEAVRQTILQNLDADYEEGMQYGMIGYFVPHRIYPAGYHCDPKLPLCFAALASQKNYMSIYLPVYADSAEERAFRAAWIKTGKKLDMGKCCIRFKKLDDVALDVIARTIADTPVAKFIDRYENVLRDSRKKPAAKTTKKVSKKATPSKPVKKKTAKGKSARR